MAVDASAQSAVAVNVGEVNVQSDDGIAAFLENAFLQIENSLFVRLVNGFFNHCGIGEYQGVAGVEHCSAGEKANVTRDFVALKALCGGVGELAMAASTSAFAARVASLSTSFSAVRCFFARPPQLAQ